MNITSDNHHTTELKETGLMVHQLFEVAAADHLETTAVIYNEESITYNDLNIKASSLSNYILKHKFNEDIIAVSTTRSIEMIVSILAILKAGKAYLPLDPTYPDHRLIQIKQDSDIKTCLALSKESQHFESLGFSIIRSDQSYSVPPVEGSVQNINGCVLYTSGSTGKPKGVCLNHTGLTNFLLWQKTHSLNGKGIRSLQFCHLSFDASFMEIFVSLISGGTLYLIDDDYRLDGSKLLSFLIQKEINKVFFPYVTLQYLSEAAVTEKIILRNLLEVTTGGELLKITPSISTFFSSIPDASLINIYGPTETTICVTTLSLKGNPEKWPKIPTIGSPMAGADIYFLSETLELLDKGKTGELCISGPGLANGYLNQPELTEEKFIDWNHPVNGKTRIYRTGDLGKFLDNGEIDFGGRRDSQVKIRGNRVELGEIEIAINQQKGIEQTVVILREDQPGRKRLVAYMVGDERQQSINSLIDAIKDILPDYMVPSNFVWMDILPKTTSGKIDKNALPIPDSKRPHLNVSYKKPSAGLEQDLANILADILQYDRIGANDNFFELGGNSLLAQKTISKIRYRLNHILPITKLYQYPSISEIANYLEKGPASLVPQNHISDKISNDTDIAVIGMAARFPGADTIPEFWNLLVEGKETTTYFSFDELDPSIPDQLKNDPSYVRARGIIHNADQFDPLFFGISPKLAELMDPQQRVFLELAYEVLEQNGHLPSNYSNRIGVFAGNGNNTYYENNVLKRPDLIENIGKLQVLTVNEKDYIASRTAYHLDLKGPAVSVNSACSTSLLAIAEAVNSLRAGQCEVAIAGAASIASPVNSGHLYQEGSMLSADGHCHPFDNNATGTVFSDGAGVVLLKRLHQAKLDGDIIYSLIKGIGVNNDGSGKGSFTAPSAEGQSYAIKSAIEDANIDASNISYIETHGTGTPIGDPIEFEGLINAFGEQGKNQFCAIGSVKSNFGHLTQAAGVAGFIKTCLSLYNKKIPATIGFKEPNRNIDFKNSPFYVNDRLTEWESDQKRIAGVSSFGVGGTNVHVIVEEYQNEAQVSTKGRPFELLTWSGQSEASSNKYPEALLDYIKCNPLVKIPDIAYSLQRSRQDFRFRKYIVLPSLDEQTDVAFEKAIDSAGANVLDELPGEMVFTFPGQGTQYLNMANDLYKHESVYKEAVDQCADLLKEYIHEDIRKIIFADESDENAVKRLKDTKYTQPALFVTEYALAKLWIHWGIRPSLFCGHSIGEYVAAHLAGVFSLQDGLRLIASRGQMVSNLPSGGMLSVRSNVFNLSELLPETLSIAAINTYMLSVVAGPDEEIAKFSEKLNTLEIANKHLFTSHAFHSAMMDPIVEEFKNIVKKISLSPPLIPIVSTVTGLILTDLEATDPEYWAGHLRKPVRFNDAIETILTHHQPLFLEIGPGTSCSIMIRQIAAHNKFQSVNAISSLNSNENDYRSVLNALGQLWCNGQRPDFKNFYIDQRRVFLNLPAYQFNRSKYWVDSDIETKTIPQSYFVQPNETNSHKTIDTLTMNKNNLTLKIKKVLEDASGIEMDQIENDRSFIEIGLDSLLLTQVAISLKREFNLPITFRKLNEDYSNIASLTEYISQNTVAEEPKIAQHNGINIQPAVYHTPALSSNGTNDTALGLIVQQLEILTKQVLLMHGGNSVINTAPLLTTHKPDPVRKETFSDLTLQEKSEISKPFGATPKIDRNTTELNEKQLDFLSTLIKRYNKKTLKSKNYAAESRSYMADPRVVSGFKPLTKELVYPIVINKSSGSKMWDIDGNEYIDVLNGFGSNLLGYQPDVIKKAMHDQIDNGYEVGPQHELAAEVSKLICEFTGFDRSALCSTGSEAVLGCIRIARTVTGRSLIVAFTGSYHGIIDEVLVRGTKKLKSFPAAAGIMPEAVQNILVLDYGTDEALQIIKERADEIAAVLIEPIQSRRPEFVPLEFIKEVRKITETSGSALIFDEVITGFRMHPGGAQALFEVRADLASYGKVVGAGIPIGVIAGKKQFMDALDGGTWNYGDHSFPEVGVTYFAGTFVRHPLALAAAKASLIYMKEKGPALQSGLNELGDHIAHNLNHEIQKRRLPFFIANYGSLWKVKFHEEVPYSELMFTLMREKGIHILDGFPCFVTEATSIQDIELLIKCFIESMDEMIDAGFFVSAQLSDAINDPGSIVINSNHPPVPGARLGKDQSGNPAWFIKDPNQDNKYLQIGT